MIKPSQYNLVLELNEQKSALINTLTGAIDILSSEELQYLHNPEEMEDEVKDYFYQRQYLIDDIDEEALVKTLFKEITDYKRDRARFKSVIILTFDCNLRCTYCWQQNNLDKGHRVIITEEKIDSLFIAIEEIMANLEHKGDEVPVIQLFGGEPLLDKNKRIVEYILEKCSQRNWSSQITTNGEQLNNFMDFFEKYPIGEVQVTVDGTSEIHEKRRVGSSYNKIMDSIDALLQMNKVYVKLRVNIDATNIDSIPNLADEIINRQWYTNRKFYGYLAPLRDSSHADTLLIRERSRLLKKLLNTREAYPQLEIFDTLGWNGYEGVKFLENTGRMPYPKTHICDANMNQFVFTPNGEIYLCAEEAHNPKSKVGDYWPKFQVNNVSLGKWYDKSPFELADCGSCSMLPLCGGGCQLFVENKEFKSEFCKSVKECFSMGVKNYLEMEGLL